MNLLFVGTLPQTQIGGGMTHFVALARAMLEAGHQVDVIAHPRGSIARALEGTGARIFPGQFRNVFDLRGYAAVRRTVRARRPDVLVSNFGKEYWPLVLCGRLLGVPVALFRHRLPPMSAASEYLLPRVAQHFFAVSDYAREVYAARGMPRERIKVLYNPVDTMRFRPDPAWGRSIRARFDLPDEAIVVGFVGRFYSSKGVFELESALREAMAREPRLHALWIGDSPEQHALRERVIGAPHAARHRLVGWIDDAELPGYYNACSMVVFAPVMAETFGRVAIEAQACGVPVLVSDLGGTTETVEPDVGGLLLPTGDVAALRDGILRLCDPALREPMGHAARTSAERRFSLPVIAEAFARQLRGPGG